MNTSPPIPDPTQLARFLGRIDIYLLDQLLKGNIHPEMRILDAGCGNGRNIFYLMQLRADVYGVDSDAERLAQLREEAQRWQSDGSGDRFRHEPVEELSFPPDFFDAVICSAVLHFARDRNHFDRMMDRMWQVLKPGGIFFARLATRIGMEGKVLPLDNDWFRLPDGTDRFLLREEDLLHTADRLGGQLYEPLKTVWVQDQRAMTTWYMQKY
jgi:SAM-dependent methyltransferase